MASTSSHNLDLESLADEYAQTVSITSKQYDYLCALLVTASDDVKAQVEKILKDISVEELATLPFEEVRLTYHQVRMIINKLHYSKPASEKQIALIKDLFPLKKIVDIFHNKISSYEELTNGQVKTLLSSTRKFTFKMKDYPLRIHPAYEFGIQETTGADCGYILYLKFYDFLMLDFDKPENVDATEYLDVIREKLLDGPTTTWALYETPRGYHAFLMTSLIRHNEPVSDLLATHYDSDHYYRLSSFKNGYRVRLTKKNDGEEFISRFIEYVGDTSSLDPQCSQLKEVHDGIMAMDHGDAAEIYSLMKDNDELSVASNPRCYYSSWLQLIASEMKLEHAELAKPGFRKYLLAERGQSLETVKLFAPALKIGMHKPQRLLQDCTEFYIAIDMLTHTYYVCYKHLLMLDIDFYKEIRDERLSEYSSEEYKALRTNEIIEQLTALVKERPELTFRVYLSQGGIHAFLTSRYANRNSDEDIQLMLDNDVDFNYTVFSYLRGWSVRLNRKRKEEEGVSIYQYHGKIGSADENPKMVEQVRLHELLAEKYKSADPCLMYGG